VNHPNQYPQQGQFPQPYQQPQQHQQQQQQQYQPQPQGGYQPQPQGGYQPPMLHQQPMQQAPQQAPAHGGMPAMSQEMMAKLAQVGQALSQQGQTSFMDGQDLGGALNRVSFDDRGYVIFTTAGVASAPQPSAFVVIGGTYPQKFRSVRRMWWARAFNPKDKPTAPDCSSEDGDFPDTASPMVQGRDCKTCPQNQEGSGVQGGRACRFNKSILLFRAQPVGPGQWQVDPVPYLYAAPATTLFTDYDQQTSAMGLFAQAKALSAGGLGALEAAVLEFGAFMGTKAGGLFRFTDVNAHVASAVTQLARQPEAQRMLQPPPKPTAPAPALPAPAQQQQQLQALPGPGAGYPGAQPIQGGHVGMPQTAAPAMDAQAPYSQQPQQFQPQMQQPAMGQPQQFQPQMQQAAMGQPQQFQPQMQQAAMGQPQQFQPQMQQAAMGQPQQFQPQMQPMGAPIGVPPTQPPEMQPGTNGPAYSAAPTPQGVVLPGAVTPHAGPAINAFGGFGNPAASR
jgi:hypothetical protein